MSARASGGSAPRRARTLAAPRSFRTAAAFRAWLAEHHAKSTELRVRLFKTHAAGKGMTYAEALDEALCFGWIDGVRHALDDESYAVRFTPRKPKSYWSAINIAHARRLAREGRMRPAGLAAFEARSRTKPQRYSFEARPAGLDPALQRRMTAHREAWAFFQAQPPWYRRTSAFWVMSAKRPETRERRFAILIDCSRRGARIPPLARP